MARKKRTNPFYVLLLLVGVAFCVTTCAYGVMTFRGASSSSAARTQEESHPLMQWLDDYGVWLLAGELCVLGLATVGVIASDRYWTDPPAGRGGEPPESSESPAQAATLRPEFEPPHLESEV
jgi:hypothetical protein